MVRVVAVPPEQGAQKLVSHPTCRVDKKNNNWTFAGEKNLGSLGGNFNHQGKGTVDKIEATYQSDRGDHGTFSLTRP